MKKHRLIIGSMALAVAVVGTVATADDAKADDRRPCVSTTEYRQTKDVAQFRGEKKTPTRRALERRWEVRGLGVLDPEYSDKKSQMWEYPVCGYAFEDAQVWLMTNTKNRTADITYLYIKSGAVPTGSVY